MRRFGPGSFRLLVVSANFPMAGHFAHLYRYQRYAYPPYLPKFINLPNDLHVPIYMYLPTYLASHLPTLSNFNLSHLTGSKNAPFKIIEPHFSSLILLCYILARTSLCMNFSVIAFFVCVEVLRSCLQLRSCQASQLPINTVPGQA